MRRVPLRIWLVVSALFALASCGGGGGGAEEVAQPPPVTVTPTPPAPLEKLALDQSQSSWYFGTAFNFSDITRYFSQIGLYAYEAFAHPGGIGPVTADCDGGGTIRLALQDKDHSASITANDRVTVTYSACGGPSDPLTGVLQVDLLQIDVNTSGPVTIQSLRAAAGSNHLAYRITIDSYQHGTNAFSGSLDVDFIFDSVEDRFVTTSGEFAFSGTYPQGKQTLTLRDYTQQYSLNYDTLRYSLELAGRLDVDAGDVRGYYTFDTPTVLGGVQHNYPSSGKLSVHGAENGYLRLEPSSGSPGSATVYVSSSGGVDTPQGTVAWVNFIDVESYAPMRSGIEVPHDFSQPAQELAARSVDLGAPGADMAVDAPRSSIYVSVPQRNEIAVISTSTYQVTERIRVGQRPTGIDLSQDGATLYIANNANGMISVLDLNTRIVSAIDVAATLGGGQAFDVVEATPGVLFVSGFSAGATNHDLLRIDRTASNAIQTFGTGGISIRNRKLAVDPAGRYLYVTDVEGASLAKLDTADPQLGEVGRIDGAYNAHVPEFFPDGSRFFASGHIWNASSLAQDAGLPAPAGESVRFTSDHEHY
jgi:DNA-binding beta-propeller fold protein YncE